MRRRPIYESSRDSVASEYTRRIYSASQREMIGCSSKERARATRAPLRRLSRNNYGNHYEPRFSHHRCCFLRRPFRFHSRLRYRTTVPVPPYPLLSPISFSRPFVCFHTAEGGARTCTGGHVRKRTILGFRTVSFSRRAAGPLRSSLPLTVPTFLTMKLSLPRPVGGTFANTSHKRAACATRDKIFACYLLSTIFK